MELSVIIVNYNVKHFLEQCLYSVLEASKNLKVEIFVVDNNSVDGSTQLVRDKFPQIFLIENNKNLGFSKANNQALKKAKGKYILLLNPDTVVEEDTFFKVVNFMDTHPDAGGLGVKMIDGKGNFLPESKRGLPTPWVAFYKMFGLSNLFPKSRKFGKYHLTYLDDNKTAEVDVISGAFFVIRKATLKKTGLLDESFFMYGEDIDLSYRIVKAGYKNYYFPETTIIHYKGESTKKGSLNYVKVFYMAMVIFVKKHFSGGRARIFSSLINVAVWFHAMLAVMRRIMNYALFPLLDALIIYAGFHLLIPFWENLRYHSGYYPSEFIQFVVPVYIIFWIVSIFLSGGYKKQVSLFLVERGILWGTVAILLVYSLVDEHLRFSRALIILGSVWAAISLVLYRLILYWSKPNNQLISLKKTKRIAIAGHPYEAERVKMLLQHTEVSTELAGFIAIDNEDFNENYIGSLNQINEIIRINRIDEIIFCADNISSSEIIKVMLNLTSLDIDFKIAPPESISIIGSNSIHTAGDLYVIHINAISKAVNLRKKRMFDITGSLAILIVSPVIIWFYKNKTQFIKNIFSIITGKKSLVGYTDFTEDKNNLPLIKPGILTPADMFRYESLDPPAKNRLNILYARDYSIITDAEILFYGWQNIDR
jgi:GT2 family glycosyltransferase